MSKESILQQLRQLLIAAKLCSEDVEKGISEAQEELLVVQRTLQREAETPSLTQRMLAALREDVSLLQRIADLSLELSKTSAPQPPAAEHTWGGHLVVTECGKPGFVLRVSHDASRALAWQVRALPCSARRSCRCPTALPQVDVQVKVSGPHFKVNSSCVLSDLGVLGNAQTVIYPGCTLDSSPPSPACAAFIVTQIRKDSQSVRCFGC